MKTMLSVKTDAKLKKKAQQVARTLGLPLGTIVNRYLQKFVEEQSISFDRPEIPNAETARILRQAERDIKAGKNLLRFTTTKEMDEYLMSL